MKQATEDLQRSKLTTNPLWSDPSEEGIIFPSEQSPRTGKIKWLERFLVLSCAHRKSTRKQDALPWETAHKGCKYDFYLQSDWISYSAFPDFPFSHLLKFTDLTLHYVSTIHGTRNIKMSKVHSVSSRNPVSSTIFLSHDPWLDENSLRGMHVLYSQIAYSFISQIFKISNVLNVMLGIQWLKKKKKNGPFHPEKAYSSRGNQKPTPRGTSA